MKVSLIIPTYGREKVLVDCVRTALQQEGVDYEVIIVDQTADHEPETRSFLSSLGGRAQYHYSEIRGVARARNTGAKLASGEIFVFIDDDTVLPPLFLKNHLDGHNLGFDIVAGRVVESDSKINFRPTWILPWLRFKGGDNCPVDGPTNNVTGCNFSVSRKVFEAVGGFDEKFEGRATREDSDFAYGAYKKGFKLWYSSKAELFHHKVPSGGVKSGVTLNPLFDESHHYCELRFCRKHFAPWVYPLYKWRLKTRTRREAKRLMKQAELRLEKDLNP